AILLGDAPCICDRAVEAQEWPEDRILAECNGRVGGALRTGRICIRASSRSISRDPRDRSAFRIRRNVSSADPRVALRSKLTVAPFRLSDARGQWIEYVRQ